MKCPKCCLSKSKVVDSRINAPKRPKMGWQYWVKKASKSFDWYTPDWRARRRVCKDEGCGHRFMTIEITVDDLTDALTDAAQNGFNET